MNMCAFVVVNDVIEAVFNLRRQDEEHVIAKLADKSCVSAAELIHALFFYTETVGGKLFFMEYDDNNIHEYMSDSNLIAKLKSRGILCRK